MPSREPVCVCVRHHLRWFGYELDFECLVPVANAIGRRRRRRVLHLAVAIICHWPVFAIGGVGWLAPVALLPFGFSIFRFVFVLLDLYNNFRRAVCFIWNYYMEITAIRIVNTHRIYAYA